MGKELILSLLIGVGLVNRGEPMRMGLVLSLLAGVGLVTRG
jgi:hypothetical protein